MAVLCQRIARGAIESSPRKPLQSGSTPELSACLRFPPFPIFGNDVFDMPRRVSSPFGRTITTRSSFFANPPFGRWPRLNSEKRLRWHVQTRKQKLESRNWKGTRYGRGQQKSDKQIPHPAKSAGIRDDRRRGEHGPHRPAALAG